MQVRNWYATPRCGVGVQVAEAKSGADCGATSAGSNKTLFTSQRFQRDAAACEAPFVLHSHHYASLILPSPDTPQPEARTTMHKSRYAPKTPLEQLKQSNDEKRKNDKEKANKLMVRLQWKATVLLYGSYAKAMSVLQECEQQNGYDAAQREFLKQAESMFKLDFFEFYTFLERFLTHCLAAVGVSVSGSLPPQNFNALRFITNPDLHRNGPLATHAFHANLLEALDDEKCPLHTALGTHDARIQLGLAKDYRNAWKDADGKEGTANGHISKEASRKSVTLPELELEAMLNAIIPACDLANRIVQAYGGTSVDIKSLSSRDFEPATHAHSTTTTNDVPFEYMDVAMDAMELD